MRRRPSRKFDHVVSLGPNCVVAHHLARTGLRTRSGPFDWLLCDLGTGLSLAASLIEHEFEAFLDDLTVSPDASPPSVHSVRYPGLKFIHHNPVAIKADRHAMSRRAERFMLLLRSESRVLFIYSCRFKISPSPANFDARMLRLTTGLERFQDVLAAAYPRLDYTLLIVSSGSHGVRAKRNIVRALKARSGAAGKVWVRTIKDDPSETFGSPDSWNKLLASYCFLTK
jgi:hypothetical protein